jgi:hypothetical protein
MLNLFKSKRDPGKSPTKSSKKAQPSSNRAGVRQTNDAKSWFSKPTRTVYNNNNIRTVEVCEGCAVGDVF